MLLATIVFLAVNCAFVWRFVKPTGEYVVITVFSGLAVLLAIFGLFSYILGVRMLKLIFLIAMPIMQIMLIIAFVFLLANLLVTPRYYDKCHYERGNSSSSTGSGSGSRPGTGPHEYLECERFYYKTFAWALAFIIWLNIDLLILRSLGYHYQLREYYAMRYSECAKEYEGTGNGRARDNYCMGNPSQYACNDRAGCVDGAGGIGDRWSGAACNSSVLYRTSNCNIPASVYSMNCNGTAVRSIRMSDADSIIVS